MQLSQRKREILFAVIEDYIKDASPITSGNVKDRHISDVSSATLRNELNALEAMGFLRQLHTSGGRVPTSEGYRFYVQTLLSDLKVDASRISNVQSILEERTKSVSEIVAEIAKIVSEATNYPAVVFMNGYDNLILEEIKLIPLIENSTLLLIKTSHGMINNTINTKASLKSCEDAGNSLTKQFAGRTIKEMIDGFNDFERKFKGELSEYKILVDNLLEAIKEALHKKNMAVRSAGAVKLLAMGEDSIKDARKVFGILEDEKELYDIFADNGDSLSVDVREGERGEAGYSVVKAPIMVGGKNVGMFGVVGPQRMDYSLIASAIKFVSNELENLDKLDKGEKNV